MFYRDKIIRILNSYKKDLESFGSQKSIEVEKWINKVKKEKIENEGLIKFLENQIHYYGPKDREYTKYLEKLIKINRGIL